MTVLYDIFQSTGVEVKFPKEFPFEMELVSRADASISKCKVRNYSDIDLRKSVAVRINKPIDPMVDLAERIYKHINSKMFIRAANNSDSAKTLILTILQENVKLSQKPKPVKKSHLDEFLVDCVELPKSYEVSLRRWYLDEDCPRDYLSAGEMKYFGNDILVVREVSGGRIVMAPTGHSVAYSTVKDIWGYIQRNQEPWSDKIKVGELCGRTVNYRTFNLTITSKFARVGCQVIPISAIRALARHEGWTVAW